jgi:hypothetical protein
VDLVHGPRWTGPKGYTTLLIWAADLHRTAGSARWQRAAAGSQRRRRRAAAAAAGSPEKAKMASRAPYRTGRLPEERGEQGEDYQGLEGVGAAPEEEIGGAPAAVVLRCGGDRAAVREEERGEVRDVEGVRACIL